MRLPVPPARMTRAGMVVVLLATAVAGVLVLGLLAIFVSANKATQIRDTQLNIAPIIDNSEQILQPGPQLHLTRQALL